MNEKSLKFNSGDARLRKGFEWAKAQAEAFVHDDAGVGPCYEAALPGRDAFCMRDMSHQSGGAHCLGLSEHNKSMMRAFARSISEAKDWCGWWEITFDGKPAPVDYTSDTDFWYNLPANFDIMDTASRLYDLTGDAWYLLSPEMEDFFRLTAEKYIPRWDRDGDGIVDRVDSDGRRGIASYEENGTTGYRTAADTLALEYRAYLAAARMASLKKEPEKAAEYQKKADRLQKIFCREWWSQREARFYEFRMKDGSFSPKQSDDNAMTPLRCGIIQDPIQIAGQIRYLLSREPETIVELRSYYPAMLWKYGWDADAMRIWLKMTAEDYKRRDYPEVSYAAVEALLCGYMGITADADRSELRTRSAAIGGEWSEVSGFPLWGGSIDLRHEGRTKSVMTNRTERPVIWTAETAGGVTRRQVKAGETAEVCDK